MKFPIQIEHCCDHEQNFDALGGVMRAEIWRKDCNFIGSMQHGEV